MRIKSIRLENFRSFEDETVSLDRYSCFVGPNGAGKSTILAALNVFFQEQASSTTDVNKLIDEDYFCKNISQPVRITVTFEDLGAAAAEALADYVRQDLLIVSAEAAFDENAGFGQVKHFGQRPGMVQFQPFFDAVKASVRATDLNAIYEPLRQQFNLPTARSKDDKADALRAHEAAHPELCVLLRSEDNFYGFNSTGKLAAFVQWVFVPAVKDAAEEGVESKNTALGKLLARTVRLRTTFETDLELLKTETLAKYRELLASSQVELSGLSEALRKRLQAWSNPNVRLGIEWLSDANKSVVLQQPVAGIKTGDGDFVGNLSRMGHGLQRSYLLALLQELASSETADAPTLILGCEEPELYQHPPQARHLAEVFGELITANNQILVTTHSPLFVRGNGCESVRLVRRRSTNRSAAICSLTFERLCGRIRAVTGEDPLRRSNGLVAKIHQALQPGIAEMFFAQVPILVEGLEDLAYITTELHLSRLWSEFRRLGCHLVPANGKDKLIQPLAMAVELSMPVFVVFDADGDNQNPSQRPKHEKDNKALMALLGVNGPAFPDQHIMGTNFTVWQSNLTKVVKADFPQQDYERIAESVRQIYGQEGGLEKNELFIANWLTAARTENLTSANLRSVCDSILNFARHI
jgi:hypothetical protein